MFTTLRPPGHAIVFLVFAKLCFTSTHAADDRWQQIGPGGGGHLNHPAISPHDSSLVFVGSDIFGFYRSKDSGNTWKLNSRIREITHPVVFHPSDENVVFVSTRYRHTEGRAIYGGWSIWRSNDRGSTWDRLYDHRYSGFSRNGISALIVDPADSQRMWAALMYANPAPVLVSNDGGKSWTSAGKGLPPGSLLRMFLDPRSEPESRRLFALANSRLHVSRDEGRTWRPLTNAGDRLTDLGVAVGADGSAPTTLYVTTGQSGNVGGIKRSVDEGKSWVDLSPALLAVHPDGRLVGVGRIATNRVRPDTVYVHANLEDASGNRRYGAYRTTDAGRSWSVVLDWVTRDLRLTPDWREGRMGFEAGWIPLEFNWGWGGAPLYVTTCETNPNHVITTDHGRVLGSNDGGNTWKSLYAKRITEGRYVTRGLDPTACYRVVFDPHDSRRMWVTYADIGNWRSDDRGKTWRYALRGARYQNTMYELCPDTDIPGRLYGVSSGTHDLPTWRYISREPKQMTGGFVVSNDGGLTWTMPGRGLPDTACTSLVIDPRSPAENRTLYTAAFGYGVYKSVDSGNTWTPRTTGMESIMAMNEHVFSLALGPNGTLYAGITKRVRFTSGQRDSRGGALFISEDGAETWRRIGPQLPERLSGARNDFSYIWDIGVNPHDPDEVIVACCIDVHSRTFAPGGLYRSRDKGQTWQRILDEPMAYRIDFHPSDANVRFCGSAHGLFVSEDRGDTWNRVDDFPFKEVYRPTVDPTDPNRIWVATRGGGVWTGLFRQ